MIAKNLLFLAFLFSDVSDSTYISRLSGQLIDCQASVEDVDRFNNLRLFPLLQTLLQQNYFRYYKVNMNKPCPLWREDRECTSRECGIENCDEEVPAGLRIGRQKLPDSREEAEGCPRSSGNKIDPLDTHISTWQKAQFQKWADHDESLDNRFCDVDDEDSSEMHYVDLQRNPERYTGYKGDSALRVWRAIYEENCFKPDPKFDKEFLLHPTLNGLCLEKRAFYRLISGLHTSITVSIASHNYQPPKHTWDQGKWVRNVEMFKNRFFHLKDSKMEGVERLKNLYFVYLLELRALQKLSPYLVKENFFTGVRLDDQETRRLIEQLSILINAFPQHFDETVMFRDVESLSRTLKEQFRRHFLNISRIMDCVGCDKCRLWGKLQTHGIGTALKILFSDNHSQNRSPPIPTTTIDNVDLYQKFQLQRNDLVALVNSLGRFASSISQLEEFRQIAEKSFTTEGKKEL
uniref:Uncharacterized protein n=1 Tax=Romanomermis culicivorax TaxID=13658 RepID=A0A915HYB5_ROMCU